MNDRGLQRSRMVAVIALMIAVAIALPRFLTHSPMRLGVAVDKWWGDAPTVEEVKGGPALGRLQPGDRLLELDGESLTDLELLKKIQATGFPRRAMVLTIERDGEIMEVEIPPVGMGVWERLRHVIFPISALLAAPLVAFLLIWRRPDLVTARLFLWFACLQGLGAVWALFPHPMVEVGGAFETYNWAYTVLVWWYPASFLHFITMFPRPRWTAATRWTSPWFWLVGAAYLYPVIVWGVYGARGGPPPMLYAVYQGVVFALGVVALVARYARRSDGEWQPRMSERVLAILVGISMGLAAVFGAFAETPSLLSLFPPAVVRLLFTVLSGAWLMSPLVIAYLIANDPVFDPRRVLVQSVPYAILSGILAALYLGIVLGGQRMFASATGEDAILFNVIAALVVAFAFAPLRERLQGVLDRLFGRDPRALRAVLDAAGHNLLSASSRAEVESSVAEGLRRALKRPLALEWEETGPPRIAEGEEVPDEARAGVENLLSQAGTRLESLRLQEERAAAERRAVELREAAARAELQALHAQVQPHFLFNALNALSYLTETDPPAAQRFTERLADMLRYTVEAGNRRAALLSEEIQFVEDYLGVARERYENPLHFEYEGPKDLLSVAVPPLLLQPLVENSLKHGVPADERALHLKLVARNSEGWITIEFFDDGCSGETSKDSLGVGLENLAQRVRRFAGPQADLDAGPMENGGFRVTLRWRMLKKVA